MRRAAKLDGNQGQIVQDLRKLPGCSVQSLAKVGDGCPDILVGYHGVNYLFEIKMPGEKLKPGQKIWHETWLGKAWVVWSLKDVLFILAGGEPTNASAPR